MTTRTETVSVRDITLAATLAGDASTGDADRPAYVLLHGWPQCRRIWDPVLDALAHDAFVIAFDLPDVGESRGAPPNGQKAVLADLVLEAAERLGARRPVVAGVDAGGMVAFAAARAHAARVRGAVVMNTVLPGLDPWAQVLADPRIWHFAFHQLPGLPELLVHGHERAYFDFFTDALAGNRAAITDADRDAFAQAYARPESLKAGFDWYRALPADAEQNAPPRDTDTPLLYVRGDADGRPIDPYVAGLRANGFRRVSSRVIPGGELVSLEQPAALVDALRAFLAETADRGAAPAG